MCVVVSELFARGMRWGVGERGGDGGEGPGKGSAKPNSKLNSKTKGKASMQRFTETTNQRHSKHQKNAKQTPNKRQNAQASSQEIRRSRAAAWIWRVCLYVFLVVSVLVALFLAVVLACIWSRNWCSWVCPRSSWSPTLVFLESLRVQIGIPPHRDV